MPGRERNGERNKILGADFVTRSNYFVTSDRRRSGALSSSRLSLRDATDFDSIVRQHRLRYPAVPRPGERRGDVGIAMRAPTLSPSIGLIADVSSRPRRPRLTPLLQIDGYPTSTVPGRSIGTHRFDIGT